MSDLLRLADACEAGSADHQGRLLEEAWEAMAAESADFRKFACAPARGFGTNGSWFAACLEARAYLSAAMMLMPDCSGNWPQLIYAGTNPNNPAKQRERVEIWTKGCTKPIRGHAATYPLALTAACLRALASNEQINGRVE